MLHLNLNLNSNLTCTCNPNPVTVIDSINHYHIYVFRSECITNCVIAVAVAVPNWMSHNTSLSAQSGVLWLNQCITGACSCFMFWPEPPLLGLPLFPPAEKECLTARPELEVAWVPWKSGMSDRRSGEMSKTEPSAGPHRSAATRAGNLRGCIHTSINISYIHSYQNHTVFLRWN